MVFEKIQGEGFEQLVYCNDSRVGLKAIISLHSTALGPATGGCRMWAYGSESEALTDVLRLSKGMTYKAAISGLNWGGGKAVIIGDTKTQKNPEMLKRFGEFVNRLGGHSVKIGSGVTSARWRLRDAAAVRRWLSEALARSEKDPLLAGRKPFPSPSRP